MAKSIGEIGDYIVGWREVDVVGFYVEDFLNAVKSENIDLWDIRKIDQCHISFKIHSFSSDKLLELADIKQSFREMEITVGPTNGLIDDCLKYKLRSGFYVGFVFFSIMLVVMTSFIWKIEILGLTTLSEDVLLQSLENKGIHIGAMTSGHDFQQIKYSIIQEFDSIAYITINIQGCKAVVEVDESVIPPSITEKAPCNIYAKTDGQILLIEAYKGAPQVENYSAVRKGQLLVSGIYDSKVIGYRMVHSDAKVLARTRRTYTDFCPYEVTELVETGNKDVFYTLNIFGLSINLSFFNKINYDFYESVSEETELCLGKDIVLPISIVKTVLYEQKEQVFLYDEKSAQKRIIAALDEKLRIEFHGIEIEDKEELFTVTDEGVYGFFDFTVIEDICEVREIEVEIKD